MISVVMCSHNPRPHYITRAIDALRLQTLDHEGWELIVIDNASTRPLSELVDTRWHAAARILREEKLGLTPARLAGIRAAVGDVLVFVDDDNLLDPDYLATVNEIAQSHGFLGAWSGSVKAEFEVQPPDWTYRYSTNLMIREVTRDCWSNLYNDDATTPLGAGLCVRSSVARLYLKLHDEGQRPRLLDRTGSSLLSGGDNDLGACALDLGLGCGVMASLRVTHLIPKERLAEDYLLQLVESIAYSSRIFLSLRSATRNGTPGRSLATAAANALRMARMNSRERRFHRAVRRGEARAEAELGT